MFGRLAGLALLLALPLEMSVHGRCGADAPTAPPETTRIDAVFVERSPVWWVVEVPSHHDSPPTFSPDASATRALGAEVVRAALVALETGEGGGFADETGRGPPPEPPFDVACGIRLAATVRDVATVFLRDPQGRARVIRATRTVESNSRAPPAIGKAATTNFVGRRARPASPDSTSPDPPDPLDDVRRCALLGDAGETLRLAGLARAGASPADSGSLDLLEGQALERLGRFADAADSLARFADRRFADPRLADGKLVEGAGVRSKGSDDPRDPAAEARRQASRVRARALDFDAHAAADLRAEAVDEALAALPSLFRSGRALDAVARVADAVRRATDRPLPRSRGRRRALLAAAALALDAGDRERAGVLLGPLLAEPRSDDLRPLIETLRARADAPTAPRASAPGPPVGDSRHGG